MYLVFIICVCIQTIGKISLYMSLHRCLNYVTTSGVLVNFKLKVVRIQQKSPSISCKNDLRLRPNCALRGLNVWEPATVAVTVSMSDQSSSDHQNYCYGTWTVEWPHLNSWALLSLVVNKQCQRSMKTTIKMFYWFGLIWYRTSKISRHFRNKSRSILKISKNVFYK